MIKNIDTDFNLNLAKSKKAFESHDIDLYRKYLSAASLNIRDMIESGHINLALNSEVFFSRYIKLQENEENYFLAYLGHKNIFWNRLLCFHGDAAHFAAQVGCYAHRIDSNK